MKVFRLEEPELYFAENEKCPDPQVGLLNFGPHGGIVASKEAEKKKVSINAGIIGTTRSINATLAFLSRLNHRISAEEDSSTEYKGVDFPGLGLNSPLRFEISVDENCVQKIDREFIRHISKLDRKERISQSVSKYCEIFDILTEAYPRPAIILLPLDDELLTLCKDPRFRSERIVYQHRDFGDPDSANAPLFDFHNYLKAQAAHSKRNFVTQMLRPDTLVFSEERQSAALIAWNFSVETYYKATGVPWKLADISENACFIGISFYREIMKENMAMRASIAQVYMRTGESQVISGRPFEWNQNLKGRQVQLNSSQMAQIIKDSVGIFYEQRKKIPDRLVVHKSTKFSDDEIRGCVEGAEDVDEIDIVHISDYTGFRAYHHKYDFPAVRGTVIADTEKNNEAILFTSGYVPALGTYPGPSAPRPLHVGCQRLDTSIETVCTDILGLSKLDWNSSTFYTRLPVTIGVSKKVGDILAEMVLAGITPPSSYRYYM
jgi:hypothetical protein